MGGCHMAYPFLFFINPLNKSKLFYYNQFAVQYKFHVDRSQKQTVSSFLQYELFTAVEWNTVGILTDFQHTLIFLSEFSVLPLKINDYLLATFPTDEKSRKMRTCIKVLNISSLHFEPISPPCNKHRFSM